MILPEVKLIKETIIATRRDIHAYPELAFQEHRTASVICKQLEELGLSPRSQVGRTGVVCDIGSPGGNNTCIALRADMDALPLEETSDVPYRSRQKGIMHACGHDGHVAMLLGAARVLKQKESFLKGQVRLIFQPAEEGAGGAREMIRDGALEGVREIYGLHLWNYQATGEVGVRAGPVLAAADEFILNIAGKGGHGATPQGTVDAVLVAAQLIVAMQSIISRNLDPLDSGVITAGQIESGSNFNIIAESARIRGTIRAYQESTRQLLHARLHDISRQICSAFGAEGKLEILQGYPPTINAAEQASAVENAARQLGLACGPPYLTMGAEDFSFYGQHLPSCFFFIGSRPEGREVLSIPHHCSHFDINEEALLIGTSMFVQLVDHLLMKD